MAIVVHHQPVTTHQTYNIHAWAGLLTWDLPEQRRGETVDFALPDVGDARHVRFLFRATDPTTHQVTWEPDAFIRHIRLPQPTDIWSFEQAARILYDQPNPPGRVFNVGDTLTFNVISERRFKGGQLYVWNPYAAGTPSTRVPESARTDPQSTFSVRLEPWMTTGFHFKLVSANDEWEPDSSNRVWRPSDGDTVWLKSGQVSVRRRPLLMRAVPIEALFPARLASPPRLDLIDAVEGLHWPLAPTSVTDFDTTNVFKRATYTARIYPGAVYLVSVLDQLEGSVPARPFPARPIDAEQPSRLVLGAPGWVQRFPAVAASAELVVQPLPRSSLGEAVKAEITIGAAPPFADVPVNRQADGTWRGTLTVLQTVPHTLRLVPASGDETRPYDWIDPRRFFTPPAEAATYFTTEGVFGLSRSGATTFGEPPSRTAVMQAAFGARVVAAGVFGPDELPHGATQIGGDVMFVLHAPHAVTASVVLVHEQAPGGPVRVERPMQLTNDTRYWWCQVPGAEAPAGTRYRYRLNHDREVLDPAARQVVDGGGFIAAPGGDPRDPATSWSVVADVTAARATAWAQPWQTLGWEALLVYEMHAQRFTDTSPGGLGPFDLVADELKSPNRFGNRGYLTRLPVTALELLPVHEFKSSNSWGYNPSFFFAIESSYGGAPALARMVNAAHASSRGVLLDVVFNHMNDSPLTQVAYDVYRNGDAWGDRINNAHPMVQQFFRQAIVYLWRTFGVDGFRFDDTRTIVQNMGWDFLRSLRQAVRLAASAEGRAWPYFIAENDPKPFDITHPGWNVMDGEWAIDEVYRLREATYDSWQPADDHAPGVTSVMDAPPAGGRPFFEATRFGESHDAVSGQDPGNKRVAMRPPFGQGLRMAKAVGALVLLSRGVPMLFMGQEVGETRYFSFDAGGPAVNPQLHDQPADFATDQTRVLAWFRALMGLRNDPAKGLRGDATRQVTGTGRRTVSFTCGSDQRLFVVVTFGTPDQRQNSGWLHLPGGAVYKEIFNSSWPVFQVELEPEASNGSYDAVIWSGDVLNLPAIGAVVLERR